MATIGRNHPCPCGSGLKYKRCCLGTDADATRTETVLIPRARHAFWGPGRTAAALQEILVVGTDRLRLEDADDLEALDEAVDLSMDHLPRDVVGPALLASLLMASAPGQPPSLVGVPISTLGLAPDAREVLRCLRASPLHLCRLERDRGGPRLVHLGPDRREVPVEEVIFLMRGSTAGVHLAWQVDVGGATRAVALTRVGREGQQAVRTALADRKTIRTGPDDNARILAEALDPGGKCRLSVLRAQWQRAAASQVMRLAHREAHYLDGDTWDLGQCLHGGVSTEIRWVRELIALAATPERRETAYEWVDEWVSSRYGPYRWADLELTDVTDAVLVAFGLQEDDTMPGADEASLRKAPAGLLLLPPDHVVWRDCHPSDAIDTVLAWKGPAAATVEIRHAWDRYHVEARWLATFCPGSPLRIDGRKYAGVIHALRTLFDPRVMDLPLGQLPIRPKGVFTRILKVLDAGEDHTLRTLPELPDDLWAQPGFGAGSLDRLTVGLVAAARTWREDASGVRPSPPPAVPAERRTKGHQALQEGLDELAALFDA